MRLPRVAVAIPSYGKWSPEFGFDLFVMGAQLGKSVGEQRGLSDVTPIIVQGTYVHKARQQLAQEAIGAGADFILWLDSDMRFPASLPYQLMMHGKAIVGANYSMRAPPLNFTAIKDAEAGKACVTMPDSTGLERVDAIGFGAVLTRADAFDMPKPWFACEWGESGELDDHVGEDFYFCRKAREHGHHIFVDHDVSKQVSHIGDFKYGFIHPLEFIEPEQRDPPQAAVEGSEAETHELAIVE